MEINYLFLIPKILKKTIVNYKSINIDLKKIGEKCLSTK
jgi:hypothetical protein